MRQYSIHELVHSVFYTGMHRDGIRAIFWGAVFRRFAMASVGLFVPIFVYKVGFSTYGDSFVAGLRVLITYLVFKRLSIISMSLFVEHIIDGIGFRWTFLISSIFLALQFVLLPFAETDLSFLWIAAVVSGIVTSTFWIARHALFGEDQDIASVGSSLGFVVVLSQLSTVVGPVVGGFIASLFGFSGLFHFGLVLAALSGLPYFFMHHHRRHHPDGLSGLLDKLRDPANFPLVVSWFGRGWEDMVHVNFWPLYVFLVVGAVERLGVITSAVAIVAMFSSYIAGRVFDKTRSRKRVLLTGAGITAILWPIKALARTFGSVFFVDSIHKAVYPFYWIPLLSETYQFSFRRDTVAFFAFREVVISVGILVFLLMAFLLTFSWSWFSIFLLSGLGIVLSMSLVSYRGFR
ncbi:MFS transporter [Patescibacteria group bacterium]|nr:MFS transporter [Patescibacteria group bacterium]